MRHSWKVILLGGTAFTVAACGEPTAPDALEDAGAVGASVERGGDILPGQFIVVLDRRARGVHGLARALTARHRGRVRHVYTSALKGFAASDLSVAAAARIARHPLVRHVEPDRIAWAVGTQSMDAFNNPWGLDRVDQRDRPLSGTFVYDATGSGVRVYIVDTGIRPSHVEFEGRASIGVDYVGDGRQGTDCNGHGTHVAGTVGGATYGVAKSATLIAVRVLGCTGSGPTSNVIAGVDWITRHHRKPAVANMSVGSAATQALDEAVRNSIAAGVTYIASAGNGLWPLQTPTDACNSSPGRVAEALTVGATDSTDAEASFSNYGRCVDLLGPGVDIISAWHTSNAQLDTLSGTSMAAPHVAGTAALYLEGNPRAAPAEVAGAVLAAATPERIRLHPLSLVGGTPNELLYTRFNAAP